MNPVSGANAPDSKQLQVAELSVVQCQGRRLR